MSSPNKSSVTSQGDDHRVSRVLSISLQRKMHENGVELSVRGFMLLSLRCHRLLCWRARTARVSCVRKNRSPQFRSS